MPRYSLHLSEIVLSHDRRPRTSLGAHNRPLLHSNQDLAFYLTPRWACNGFRSPCKRDRQEDKRLVIVTKPHLSEGKESSLLSLPKTKARVC